MGRGLLSLLERFERALSRAALISAVSFFSRSERSVNETPETRYEKLDGGRGVRGEGLDDGRGARDEVLGASDDDGAGAKGLRLTANGFSLTATGSLLDEVLE